MRHTLPHIARSSTAITCSQHTVNVPGAELTRSKVCPCNTSSHLAKDSNHPKLLCVPPSNIRLHAKPTQNLLAQTTLNRFQKQSPLLIHNHYMTSLIWLLMLLSTCIPAKQLENASGDKRRPQLCASSQTCQPPL